MRGYFAIGAEGLSKPMNFGNLMRSAHAFGASFFFTVNADAAIRRSPGSDTSRSVDHLPYYAWPDVASMALPKGCRIVGVELSEDAVDLPSFCHPRQAAYVLGPERGSLSETMLSRSNHVIRIPSAFCINVATAGAIVMYDRIRMFGGFAGRPVQPGAPVEMPVAAYGGPLYSGGEKIRGRKKR
ncbi:MAG: RNA methyltransferase [Hyphomicrobiales bacterium]|nr:RNA methyltransferase [Hyphomicrobiales bacterium]